jgi:hypothetical protein
MGGVGREREKKERTGVLVRPLTSGCMSKTQLVWVWWRRKETAGNFEKGWGGVKRKMGRCVLSLLTINHVDVAAQVLKVPLRILPQVRGHAEPHVLPPVAGV